MTRSGALAILVAFAAMVPLVRRLTDERNVRILAEHLGCSQEEARRTYRLARKHGFGAAYMQVFPGRSIVPTSPFEGDVGARVPRAGS